MSFCTSGYKPNKLGKFHFTTPLGVLAFIPVVESSSLLVKLTQCAIDKGTINLLVENLSYDKSNRLQTMCLSLKAKY